MKTSYPTIEEVEKADRIQICEWWRFLSSPQTETETDVMNLICERYEELGGVTPEIKKQIVLGQ